MSLLKRKETPHLWNINEDPALTNMLVHLVEEGENRVGNGTSGKQRILLRGKEYHFQRQ